MPALPTSPPATNAGPTQQVEHHFLQVGAARLYCTAVGTGPPGVLLHGLSGSTRWWQHNVDALARQFRVYRVDLIGFGRSRGQRFGLRAAADGLVSGLDQLGVTRAHLVGHSMGGYVAADMAARYPAHVDRLVLVNAASVPFHRTYAHDALGLVKALRYVPVNFLPVLLTDALQMGPVTLVQALREIVASDLTAELKKIQAPTLVVWGEHDTVIPQAIGRRLHDSVPNAQWAVIEGAGHNPMWDRPEAFNQVVIEFLSSKRESAAGGGE